MPKKNILLIVGILVSVSLFSLLSCQRANDEVPTPSPTAAHTPGASPSPGTAPDVPAYEVTGDTFTEGDIVIQYPQIAGLTDTERQDRINALIKDDATAIAEEGGTVDIAYTVTWTGPNLLSIQYSGLRNIEGSAYPNNLFYTTNVDIANGIKIGLSDVITIEPSFVEKIKEGEFVTEDPGLREAEDMIRETVTGYNLAGALTNADNGYGQENPDYCFTYFTENALGISVGVPHAVGDHAEFEIGYADLAGNIKRNGVWDDFADIPAPAGETGAGASLDDLYGDWAVSGHVLSNPQGSTYSQEEIEDMIGKELTYAENQATFDGETLEHPYYQTATVTKEEYEADGVVTFADLGIDSDSVMDITVCTDPQFQDVWVIPACFVFVVDKDHLIIRGDGEFFALARR